MATESASNPPTPPPGGVIDAQLAYSMCAYVDGVLSAPPPGWVETWVPTVLTPEGPRKGNYAIVLQAEAQQPALFALAIQGTQDAIDLMEDFEVTPQYSFPPIAGASIAKGSQDGLDALLALEGIHGEVSATLTSVLQSIPAGSSLLVTGHSLGGNLASVIAPWIAANVPVFGPNSTPLASLPANLTTITFAAPTAGNAAFAKFLDDHPERYRAHFNRNDVVSNVWAQSGPLQLHNIDHLFPPPGPSPAPPAVKKLLEFKKLQMARAGVSYTQTRGFIFAFPPGPLPNPVPADPWIWQLGYEHNYAYCRQFLGPDAPCKP